MDRRRRDEPVMPLLQLMLEPRFRQPQLALHGSARGSERNGDFFVAQATEEMQFDDLNLPRIEGRELRQRLIESDEIQSRLCCDFGRFVERDLRITVFALGTLV